MSRHLHEVYGLTIEAPLHYPELRQGHGPPDVLVRYGDVPASLGTTQAPGQRYEATPDRFLLRLDGIARYLVSHGNEIVIEPASDKEDERVRVYLLGTVLAALFHQRRTLVLHGSAIETRRGAVVFMAPSGSGKSTLACAFLARGYRALADDICAISFDQDGKPVVAPGYPQLKLRADAAALLTEATDALERVPGDRDKYRVPIADRFCPRPLPLHAVYVLDTGADEPGSQRLQGVDGFDALLRDTYRAQLLPAMDAQRSHFRNIAATARSARISRAGYPRGLHHLAATVDRIEADFEC